MAKVSLSRESLKRALEVVVATVHNNTTTPILKGIKFAIKENVMAAYTNNTTAFSLTYLNVESDSDFSFVVEGLLFTDLVKRLKTDEIELELDKNTLTVKAEGFKTTLSTLVEDEFPEVPTIEGIDVKLSTDSFLRSYSLTSIAASTEDTRPILKCIHFETDGKKVTMTALDGYRLATTSFALKEETVNASVNIPCAEMSKIIKNINDEEVTITIDTETNYFAIKDGTTIRGTKLTEGEFINYKQIIPSKDKANSVVGVEVGRLKNALDLMNVFKSEKPMVKFSIKDSNLSLNCLSSKGKIEKEVELLTSEGEDLEISFNPSYFDALGSLSSFSDKIAMYFIDAISPMVFEPTDSKLSFSYLLLPVRTPAENNKK